LTDVPEALALEAAEDGRADEAAVAGDVDAGVLGDGARWAERSTKANL
jgi:hypothetical protein